MTESKGASRRLFLWLAACLLAAQPALAAPPPALADTCPAPGYDETAVVRKVHDGDTVWLKDGRKLRLIGVNTPELARNGRPAEAHAIAARKYLQQRLQQHNHRVSLVFGKERFDRYRRTLAHLFLPDGSNLQAELVAAGLATANAYPPNTAFSDCYRQVEQAARCTGKGIWSASTSPLRHSAALAAGARGFHLLSGRVERVSESAKGVWLFLEGGVMIGVRSEDLAYFDSTELFALKDRQIMVRGWLHPKSGDRGVSYYMRIRHPSAIESNTGAETGTDNIPKC